MARKSTARTPLVLIGKKSFASLFSVLNGAQFHFYTTFSITKQKKIDKRNSTAHHIEIQRARKSTSSSSPQARRTCRQQFRFLLQLLHFRIRTKTPNVAQRLHHLIVPAADQPGGHRAAAVGGMGVRLREAELKRLGQLDIDAAPRSLRAEKRGEEPVTIG